MSGYISDIIREYGKGIALALVLPTSLAIDGCADLEDKEYWSKWKKDMAQATQDIRQINSESRTVDVYHHGMPRGRRVGLDAESINANTRSMLKRNKRPK